MENRARAIAAGFVRWYRIGSMAAVPKHTDAHYEAAPSRVLFAYWGRRGALSRFALNLARACGDLPGVDAVISVSRQNEIFDRFLPLGPRLLPVTTFDTGFGAAAGALAVPRLRRDLLHWVASHDIQAVVTLMPHVWSPLVTPVLRRSRARYVTVVHDADPHVGDPTGLVTNWLLRDAHAADLVVTLSATVADRLAYTGRIPREKLVTLFHPDLDYRGSSPGKAALPRGPFRLLFFGRIMAYKGLPLLLDALEILRRDGPAIEIGVYGEGDLAGSADRLRDLGAEVVNAWIADERIGEIFDRFDAVVLPNIEASQSGVAAAALASGLPIIATPVGGLVEQVQDGETGVLAQAVDAPSLAQAIRRLAFDPNLCRTIRHTIAQTRESRSMRRFVEAICALAVPPPGHR